MPKYVGIESSQTPGRRLVSFVAAAEEIREWAGVPHKTTDFVGGFQRPLSDRFRKIIEFFGEPGNSSPTAIVVAFRPGVVNVTELTTPEAWPADPLRKFVTLEIPEFLPNEPLTALAQKVYTALAIRISVDTVPVEEDEASGTDDAAESAEETEEDVPEEDAPEQAWGIDVGRSVLREFAERIRTGENLSTFIGEIRQKLMDAEGMPAAQAANEAEARVRDVLQSLLMPAMIVDGQHRIWGAAECEHEIPFTVVGIVDSDWQEQVFQFVVINKQARAISGEFLASIVNSSLTNREIVELENRLDAAGLSTYETKMLRLLNDDSDSPFYGMVSRGLEEHSRKITFKAALSLANRWRRRMNERDMVYKTVFKPGLPGATSKQKSTAWESIWKDYMFAFWSGMRNLYKDEQLWEPGTQLMYRATLEVIQDNYLEAKALAGIAFSDPVVLREDVEKFYKNVVGGFFHTEWKRKELLTDDGRRVLRDALNVMRVPGTKLRQLVSSHPLFTGAGSKAKVAAGGSKAEKKEKKPK